VPPVIISNKNSRKLTYLNFASFFWTLENVFFVKVVILGIKKIMGYKMI